jgi:hypothetical protein
MKTAFDRNFDRGLKRMLARQGRTIIYIPLNGTPRSVVALVDELPPGKVQETGEVIAAHVNVEARDLSGSAAGDGYGGIDSRFVDTGGDKVKIETRGEWSEFQIRKVLKSSDSATISLECG